MQEATFDSAVFYAGENIDFADAISGCWMKREGIETLYTFDQKHYKRIQGIRVKAPPSSRWQNK